MANKKLSQFSAAVTDTDTQIVALKTVTGVSTDYRIPIADLKSYINTGTSVVVSNTDLAAQTIGVTIATYAAGASAETFLVSGYVNITTAGTANLNFKIDFTDINNNAQHLVIPNTISGTASLNAALFYPIIPTNIRAKHGTNVVISVAVVSGSGMTYDCGATVTKIN